MSVMYIRNEQTGEFEPVPSLVGPQGPPGTNGDGAGTVTAVNKVAPDANGNVTLTAADVGALPSDGTAVNANALNGKDADEYALKTDLPTKASDVGALAEGAQAADSAKLDGKDSVYYLGARNLLDNSDFRNPVNQRGQLTAVNGTYLFDRWIVANEAFAGNVTASTNSSGTTFTNDQGAQRCCVLQRIYDENCYDGKYTAALKTTNGLIIGYIDKGFGGTNIHQVTFWIDNGATVVWAALYEGSYTADNLPPYVPKGYAVELAECMRYYQRFGVVGLTCRNNGRASVNLHVPMRINSPDVIIGDRKVFTDTYEDKSGTYSIAPVANKDSIFFENQFYEGFVTIYCENVQVSADL